MKKKIAKSLSFLLVAGMLLSLTACGGSAVSSGAPAASEKTDAPVTITILGALDAKTMQNGIQSDPVAKYIEKKLGIQMNVIIADTAGDIGSKINAMIATNDLPDICYLPDFTKQLMAAEKAGELLPLDSYLADYGKNLNSIPINKFSNAYFKKNLSVDGKLYGLGTLKGAMDNGLNPGISNYIRWDLYKQLGYPAINTWDDLLPILKKMQDLEPKTKDGSKVYGIGAFFGESGSDALITYMPGYVNGVLSLGSCWSFDAKTNSMSDKDNFNDLNSSWWQSIRFFNKAYQMGILDPDSITQKNTQYMEKVQAGKYLWVPQSGNAVSANDFFSKSGEKDKGFVAIAPLTKDAFIQTASAPTGQNDIVISKNCKHPEKAVELLDFFNSYEGCRIVTNGVEGTNWNMVNGKPTATEEYKNATIDTDFEKKTGAMLYQFFNGLTDVTIDPTYNQTINLLAQPEVEATHMTTMQKDAATHYGMPLDQVYSSAKVHAFSWDIPSSLNDAQANMPDSLKVSEDSIVNYVNNFCRSKLIYAKTDAEFTKAQQEFISTVNSKGLDKVFNYYKSQSASINAMYDKLLQETGYKVN